MNFKHWPPASPETASRGGYWIKGGVAGFIVVLILIVLNFQAMFLETTCPLGLGVYCPSAWENFAKEGWYQAIIVFVIFVALGMCAGYLYGKFKNRHKPVVNGNSS